MARSRLLISGISASGRHGANPGEADEAQAFVVDLEVTVDVKGDDLESTVDYRAVIGAAVEAVENSSVVLLETLADAVARAVAGLDDVTGATARVHKPAAAGSLEVGDIAAEATVGP